MNGRGRHILRYSGLSSRFPHISRLRRSGFDRHKSKRDFGATQIAGANYQSDGNVKQASASSHIKLQTTRDTTRKGCLSIISTSVGFAWRERAKRREHYAPKGFYLSINSSEQRQLLKLARPPNYSMQLVESDLDLRLQ